MNLDFAKRTEYMRRYAEWMKMSFHETDEWGLQSRLLDFDLFKKGNKKEITNLMELKDGFLEEQVYIFDYAYTRGSNHSRKRFRQTVFFIQSKQLGLPEFLMQPETFFHKIGNLLGMQDIDFVEHEQFSNQYLLTSPEEERLRSLMSNQVLHFFTIEKNWTMEGIGYFLIFYKNNTLLSPATIEHFQKKGMSLYQMFKGK